MVRQEFKRSAVECTVPNAFHFHSCEASINGAEVQLVRYIACAVSGPEAFNELTCPRVVESQRQIAPRTADIELRNWVVRADANISPCGDRHAGRVCSPEREWK